MEAGARAGGAEAYLNCIGAGTAEATGKSVGRPAGRLTLYGRD